MTKIRETDDLPRVAELVPRNSGLGLGPLIIKIVYILLIYLFSGQYISYTNCQHTLGERSFIDA